MLRLMTLNLWGYEQWDSRKLPVMSLMERLSPDVIVLQEVRLDVDKSPTPQSTYLSDNGNYPYVIYIPSFRNGRRPRGQNPLDGYSHGLALLSRYPILSSESYLLSQDADFDEPCSVLLATIEIDGNKVDICNVHFGNTDKESIQHLIELSELLLKRDIQPIIAGDFNIFKLHEHLQRYQLSTDHLDYISIPKNNGTLDYIAIPNEYSFNEVICPQDIVSDHRAVFAEIKKQRR